MDKCYLCKSKKVDDIQYGEFLRNAEMGFGVHTFCLVIHELQMLWNFSVNS